MAAGDSFFDSFDLHISGTGMNNAADFPPAGGKMV
jgi:hypothetical protein